MDAPYCRSNGALTWRRSALNSLRNASAFAEMSPCLVAEAYTLLRQEQIPRSHKITTPCQSPCNTHAPRSKGRPTAATGAHHQAPLGVQPVAQRERLRRDVGVLVVEELEEHLRDARAFGLMVGEQAHLAEPLERVERRRRDVVVVAYAAQ